MATKNFPLEFFFILQTTIGCQLRYTSLIIRHVTVANFMVILSKAIPQTLSFFGFNNFLNDFGCKILSYVHRVGRGVSIGSTCLLSVFQAVTISPGNSSQWANNTITEDKKNIYCSSVHRDKIVGSLFAALTAFPDAVCLALMLCSSGSMVFILYRHKKRVQHIHRNVSPRASPETRATQTVIVLVSTFVSFYTLSTLRVFGCKNTLSDSECKFFSYMHKVGRGVSISSTCLLSVFQAVTITPVNSSSGSMVFFLYRHKKRVQHIHRNVSPRSSPETRATQTIIVLEERSGSWRSEAPGKELGYLGRPGEVKPETTLPRKLFVAAVPLGAQPMADTDGGVFPASSSAGAGLPAPWLRSPFAGADLMIGVVVRSVHSRPVPGPLRDPSPHVSAVNPRGEVPPRSRPGLSGTPALPVLRTDPPRRPRPRWIGSSRSPAQGLCPPTSVHGLIRDSELLAVGARGDGFEPPRHHVRGEPAGPRGRTVSMAGTPPTRRLTPFFLRKNAVGGGSSRAYVPCHQRALSQLR
ncbi:PREDICTED: uncharacterized protein LOC102869331 [Elephantulus edwardii]|uniref:uncharacterized protein LOC102869331 n=1 Tax=Elephantulus edwardii TaxID=28737 RepID=UPI0003F06659|nr:PREDICTED: uncharacterized protein LOC102869331 [Elephantulus edwardii]